MNLSRVIEDRLEKHWPKRMRIGTRVVLVTSSEERTQTRWRVKQIKQEPIQMGIAKPIVKVCELERRGRTIYATVYPIQYGNQFVKYDEVMERRKVKQQEVLQEESRQVLYAIAKRSRQLLKGLEEAIRSKSVKKSLQEL